MAYDSYWLFDRTFSRQPDTKGVGYPPGYPTQPPRATLLW